VSDVKCANGNKTAINSQISVLFLAFPSSSSSSSSSSPVPAVLHKHEHDTRAVAQEVSDAHGCNVEIGASLPPVDRVVAVLQERRKLDPSSDIHATEPVGLGLVETVPALAHVLEHPLCRDAQLRHAAVVVSFPCFVGVGENLMAMVTCREFLITNKHP
jgi:hypothetical protein